MMMMIIILVFSSPTAVTKFQGNPSAGALGAFCYLHYTVG